MQFFDYDNDLQTFNSLMEGVEDVEPVQEDYEKIIHLEAAKRTKDPNALTGRKIAQAIKNSVNGNADVKAKLFKSTYWGTESEPFEIAKINGCTFMNDPKADKVIEKKDDNNYVVNFSRLVYKKTTSNKEGRQFIQDMSKITDWSSENSEDINKIIGPFATAVNSAYNAFATTAKSYLKAPTEPSVQAKEQSSNAEHTEQPKTDSQDASKNDSQKQPAEQQNEQAANADSEKNPSNLTQQTPSAEAVPPPKDDEVDLPDDDVDQKQLYAQIMRNFRDELQQDMEIQCDSEKENGIDDYTIEQLTSDWYNKVMEPYEDQADDYTKRKVENTVAFYVRKYTRSPHHSQNSSDNGSMDWSEKTTNKNSDTNTGKQEKIDPKHEKGLGAWFRNTMNALDNAGITNGKLHYRPLQHNSSTSEN